MNEKQQSQRNSSKHCLNSIHANVETFKLKEIGNTIPALAKNPCKSCWTRKFSKCCTHGHRVYAHQATKCTPFQVIWRSVNATRSKNIQQIHNTIHWDKKFSNNLLKDPTQPSSQSNSQEWHILSLQVRPSYIKWVSWHTSLSSIIYNEVSWHTSTP